MTVINRSTQYLVRLTVNSGIINSTNTAFQGER